MREAKTKATESSVDDYLASRAAEGQRADCVALMALLGKITGQAPKMWGPSIVGYGAYAYRLAGGKTGESCLTGFAIRGKSLVIYLAADGPRQAELLARLGRHKMGKACLYFTRLGDLDGSALEQLITGSVAELKRRQLADGLL